MSYTVAQIVPREAYTESFYSGVIYTAASRALLAVLCEAENQRSVTVHLQAWDAASEDYFTVWSEATDDSQSRVYAFTEQDLVFPPAGWERVLMTPRMRVYVELSAGTAAAILRVEWTDSTSGTVDAEA